MGRVGRAAIGMAESVVIQGLGLLGLSGVAIARSRGARLVIGLDSVPGRLEVSPRPARAVTPNGAPSALESRRRRDRA